MTVNSGLGGVRSVSFSPKGDMIAAGCYNGTIHLVDALTTEVKRSVKGHNGKDGCICDCDSGDDLNDEVNSECPVTGHSGPVTSIGFSADGQWLVSGSEDKTIRSWQI